MPEILSVDGTPLIPVRDKDGTALMYKDDQNRWYNLDKRMMGDKPKSGLSEGELVSAVNAALDGLDRQEQKKKDKAEFLEILEEVRKPQKVSRGSEADKLAELPVPEHQPVKAQLMEGIANLPFGELLQPSRKFYYQEPFQMIGHYLPETREKLRKKYKQLKKLDPDSKDYKTLHEELFDEHPVFEFFTTLEDQAKQNMAFWVEWYKIARSVLDWHSADLKKPQKLPPYIADNLSMRKSAEQKKQEFIAGKPETPVKPGLFGREETRPGSSREKLDLSHMPEFVFTAPDGTVYSNAEAYFKEQANKKRLEFIDKL